MNKQGNKETGSRGIEWTHFFGPYTGFTSNPVRGCTHACEWEMPDGTIAICYAKTVAEKFSEHYPGGFEAITWHPETLAPIRARTQPAGIFIDSMSDLFGQGVKKEWIDEVIKTIRDCPHHVFFSLTKNPSRFREWRQEGNRWWPKNWLVGISAPPSFMFGKRLTLKQQEAWLKTGLKFLDASPALNKWISIEPLSFDVAPILNATRANKFLRFAVIGAASRGRETFQPDEKHLDKALAALEGVSVFFKGNLDRKLAERVAGKWREEFPAI